MDLIREIEVLNNEVKELNKKRDKLLWEKTRAEEELKNLLNEYNSKYGTALTAEGIFAEFETVKSELEKQYSQLRYAVDHINDVPPTSTANNTGVSSASANSVNTVNTGISEAQPSINNTNVSQQAGVQMPMQYQQYQVPSQAQFNQGFNQGVSQSQTSVPSAPQKRVGSMSDLESPESNEPSLEDRLMGQSFDFSKYIDN